MWRTVLVAPPGPGLEPESPAFAGGFLTTAPPGKPCIRILEFINESPPTPRGLYEKEFVGGFPGGAVVENLPANAGDTGSSPGLGRSHMPRSN